MKRLLPVVFWLCVAQLMHSVKVLIGAAFWLDRWSALGHPFAQIAPVSFFSALLVVFLWTRTAARERLTLRQMVEGFCLGHLVFGLASGTVFAMVLANTPRLRTDLPRIAIVLGLHLALIALLASRFPGRIRAIAGSTFGPVRDRSSALMAVVLSVVVSLSIFLSPDSYTGGGYPVVDALHIVQMLELVSAAALLLWHRKLALHAKDADAIERAAVVTAINAIPGVVLILVLLPWLWLALRTLLVLAFFASAGHSFG